MLFFFFFDSETVQFLIVYISLADRILALTDLIDRIKINGWELQGRNPLLQTKGLQCPIYGEAYA